MAAAAGGDISVASTWAAVPGKEQIVNRDCVFVVNPRGANGRTGKEWKNIYPKLSSKLRYHLNVVEFFTSGPYHATEIARKAVREGAFAVVAVGGDGTVHEVVNGFFENGKRIEPEGPVSTRTALGVMPLGTGCDFARTFGWKSEPDEAIERVLGGKKRTIDVGHLIIGDDHRQSCFVNVADLHLSAKSGFIAGKYKWLGIFSYVVGCLQAFMSHRNRDMDIKIDGGDWKRFSQVTAVAVGNAKYYGGGMKITPAADPSSRDLDVVILQHFRWYHFLVHLLKLYAGTHTKLKNVWHGRVQRIEIREAAEKTKKSSAKEEGVFVQADGEFLGHLPASFSVLPATLELLV